MGGRLAAAGTAIALAAALASTALAGLAWARRRFLLVTVKGSSMVPTYRDGQRIIVRRGGYRKGQVIMLRAPDIPALGVTWMVKRAVAVAGDAVPADLAERAGVAVVPAGHLLVRSDAEVGLDSRDLGLIDDRDVIGPVRTPRRAARPARPGRPAPPGRPAG